MSKVYNFMKLKYKYLIIFAAILILIFGICFLVNKKAPIIYESKVSNSYIIDYPSKYNYRQTINDCGPFNVAAVIRALAKKEIKSSDFAKNMKWRLPNKYTLPWGLEKQLQENDISIEIPNIKALPDKEKIIFLKERLSQNKPIIILGEANGYEHYMTIFGFNSLKDEFYIYDSMYDKNEEGFTVDDNNSLPGNRNFTSKELLNFWRGGGMYGVYNWYTIVADKK